MALKLKLLVLAVCVGFLRGLMKRAPACRLGLVKKTFYGFEGKIGTGFHVLHGTRGGNEEDGSTGKFVPVFVGVWAVGYTAITATQVFGYRMGPEGPSSASVGEFGGVASVVLTVGLFLALFLAAAVEVFKED